jgi:CBS domain containing-hemolysin-like protein
MALSTTLLIIVCLLALEAFFSGSEMGVVSADKMRLRHDAAKGSRGARLTLKMLEKPEWLLATTLVGTNICVVGNTTVATGTVVRLFGEQYAWIAVALLAPLIWVFGEVVPKSVFQQQANAIAPVVVYPLRLASWLFAPILALFTLLSRALNRIVGSRSENPFPLRQEIMAMVETAHPGGDIHPAERSMIGRVFRFGDTEARDIMVPLIDVVGIAQNATCGDVLQLAADKAHKRLPVYEERVDRIIGVVNALDLLLEDPELPLAPRVMAVPYVPGSKPIHQLLLDFRSTGGNLAVVVDEYGGAEGIVTLEDLIEEVVGDIEDEYDSVEEKLQWVKQLSEGDYLVSARTELATVKEKLGLDLPDGDYETLGGFLLDMLGDIPSAGQTVRYRRAIFTIEKATPLAILEVRVQV